MFKGDNFYSGILGPERPLFQKALQKAAEFHRSLASSSLRPESCRKDSFVFTRVRGGLIFWIFREVTAAAGYKVGIIPFSALFPLITVGTMLPLRGLGIREWLYVEALALVGVPKDQALVISLATSALYLLSNLANLLFLPAIPMVCVSRPSTSTNIIPMQLTDRIPHQNDVI